MEVAIECKLQ